MPIEITQADIELLANSMRLDLSDPEKIAILSQTKSCDIQAGPGSGKTTILTAKLALLSYKWQSSDTGICVLSHTNVARREIESRLGQSPSLRRFLHYPHFIGTFQKFVDDFLAFHYLRANGYEVAAIDNDRFRERASALFQAKGFFTAKALFKSRYASNPGRIVEIISGLRYQGSNLRISHPAENEHKFPSSATATGKDLAALKSKLTEYGYFRYDDMFAFAEAALATYPYLTKVLRQRFPWVFVDELQDTDDAQDRIVEHLFGGDECVLQRFGDMNQSIFQRNEAQVEQPELFGRRPSLPLSTTHRFGCGIARIASSLTVVKPQILKGRGGMPECNHSIFLFNRESIKKVVPAFADLVIDQIDRPILELGKVCAVGSRKNAQESKKFPMSLSDYWEGFRSEFAKTTSANDSLLGYMVSARTSVLQERSYAEGFACAIAGVLEYLRRAGARSGLEVPRSKRELKESLLRAGTWQALKIVLWKLLNPISELTESVWTPSILDLRNCLSPVLSANLVIGNTFADWHDSATPQSSIASINSEMEQNVFIHTKGADSLKIHFDSIHGVKGETHVATLVMETFYMRSHDIKSLVPVLSGRKTSASLEKSAIIHCKQIFVGVTRPTNLVSLAILSEHVTKKDVALFSEMGWKVNEL